MATAKEAASGLTRDDIACLLRYDPETGNLEWLVRPRRRNRLFGNEAGRVHRSGYVNVKIERVEYAAHRLAWLLMTGDWPVADIDHINGRRSDNRWSNLRAATRRENIASGAVRSNNTSGVTGVSFNTTTKVWHAYIKECPSKTITRTFKSKAAAVNWRKAQEAIHYGDFRPRAIA
jgi:hypothetical protein